MRNLKRALSLLLAAAMLIGMMVVGASAVGSLDDFSDKGEIVNQDAVSLLTILGVIEGKEDGSYFDPTGNVTRAEMAKMIATILNQGADIDGLYVGMNTGLTDVAGHWAESYINYCYSLGIIAGRGDGTFDPGATVTGNEAAKMLLVAVGYDAGIEGLEGTDWAIRTAALASNLGIFDNLNAPTNDPLTRDNAALLVYNALDIEMIQRYENGYAIVYSDYRTLLSNRYGVYRLQGVVVGNEWARLEDTNSDAALAEGKTKLTELKLIESDTVSTRPNNNGTNLDGEYLADTTFNVSTPVEYLGQTVTLYVRNTTVLANATVLGVYLKDGANTVLTTANTQDSMDDYLKGTGLSTDGKTQYYVNYGYQASVGAATAAMDFGVTDDHMNNVDGKLNGYGIEMTVIDNDDDGNVDYVLWMQETLSQVIATSTSKETTTINAFNGNSGIDNEDIVTDADLAENDLVLVTSYGGRYYVSEPQVVSGQMDSYQASKSKEQTITVDGTAYHASYALYKADTADDTYEFDITLCDRDDGYTEGVQFDTDYDFILDSNGNVIAFQPSEEGLYNYALILESGYVPGAFASDASAKVRVLLADGTEATYNLNFSASAKNVGQQVAENDGIANTEYSTNQGIRELKGFLGTGDSDNSATAPWEPATGKQSYVFANQNSENPETYYKDSLAKGYVIAYSLNADNEMTITRIVGATKDVTGNAIEDYTNASTTDATVYFGTDATYNAGAGRVNYTDKSSAGQQVVVDRNTVAFYCELDASGDIESYGVAVGYNEMTSVNAADNVDFVAETVRSNSSLAGVVLFDAEGVQAEKNYLFVLAKNDVNSRRASLDVVDMEGNIGQIEISYDDYIELKFDKNDDAYETAYAFTTGTDGLTKLTPADDDPAHRLPVIHGYALETNNGTIDLYADKACTKPIHLENPYKNNVDNLTTSSFSYEKNIWNVMDVDPDSDETAPAGTFSRNVAREVVVVLDSKCDKVRAAYITDILDGIYSGDVNLTVTEEGGTKNTNFTGKLFNVAHNNLGSGTWTFEWFTGTQMNDRNPVAIDTTKFRVDAANGDLYVRNAGALVANDESGNAQNFFMIRATYSETGKQDSVQEVWRAVYATTAPVAGSLKVVLDTNDITSASVLVDNKTATDKVEDVGTSGVDWYTNLSEGSNVQIFSSVFTAGSHWQVGDKFVTVETAGVLKFDMPATDVTISAANERVLLHPGNGVTVSGTNVTLNADGTAYAALDNTTTVAVTAGSGSGVIVSNTANTVYDTQGNGVASGNMLTLTSVHGDRHLIAAYLVNAANATGLSDFTGARDAWSVNGVTNISYGTSYYVKTGESVVYTITFDSTPFTAQAGANIATTVLPVAIEITTNFTTAGTGATVTADSDAGTVSFVGDGSTTTYADGVITFTWTISSDLDPNLNATNT